MSAAKAGAGLMEEVGLGNYLSERRDEGGWWHPPGVRRKMNAPASVRSSETARTGRAAVVDAAAAMSVEIMLRRRARES